GFGGMVVVTADWTIAHRSVNCADLLALKALPQLGAQLSECFTERAIEQLRLALKKPEITEDVARVFGLRLTKGGELMDCAIHLSRGNIVIEFEPHAAQDYADHVSLVGPMLARLEPMRDVDSLCDAAATLVRQALGYDRVMVYRFHSDDSGEVIAEDKGEDLEPYLGLRYPRADIPQQARELFKRNKFRIIADMYADSVPIEPPVGFNGEPLDLSMSVLRAHSQMHVQYMKNMGVKASLAIAIVRQGRLWGMISCHHYEPKLPAYSLRTVAEMLSQMFSLMLDRILIDRAERVRTKGRHLHDQLMLQLAGGNDLGGGLPMLDAMLKDVIKHDGCSMFIGGKYDRYGAAPSAEHFLRCARSWRCADQHNYRIQQHRSGSARRSRVR
ncbi:MAG: GAF domain-containing protein, partial [Pseudomonadota bacterium]